MTISVAYDISILAYQARTAKTGISRVVEQVLDGLGRRADVDLTVMGVSHGDVLPASIFSRLYVQSQQERGGAAYRFEQTFRSRIGITDLYRRIYTAYWSEGFWDAPKLSPRSILVRGAERLVRRLKEVDVYPSFRSERYDVFHSPFCWLPDRALTRDLPRVLTIHDLIPVLAPELVAPEQVAYFRRILDSIDLDRDWVACVSDYTRQEFCAYTGMSPERTSVIPLGAASHFGPVSDPSQIAALRRRLGVPEGNYFLSIANLEPRKNLVHLIRCFSRLLDEAPELDVNLVLVGPSGWRYDQIISEASGDARLRSRVVVTGYVPDEDLSALYSGATAFVFPSVYEGFGLPPLEAMQCGVPVIASNTTSLPEVVGSAGILVDPLDADALCQAMLATATDEVLREDLRQKGLERSTNFSWAKCTADTVELYHRAMGGR